MKARVLAAVRLPNQRVGFRGGLIRRYGGLELGMRVLAVEPKFIFQLRVTDEEHRSSLPSSDRPVLLHC